MGWRYFSDIQTSDPEPYHEIVDLAVDAAWRPVRTRIDTGSHEILLTAETERLTGFRDRAPIEIPFGPELHLVYLSPCFNAVTARRLPGTAEIEVVFLDAVTCDPRMKRQVRAARRRGGHDPGRPVRRPPMAGHRALDRLVQRAVGGR